MAVAVVAAGAQNVQFGVKGGLNICTDSRNENLPDDIPSGHKYRTGVHFGGLVNVLFSDVFEVQTDVMYSMQGFKDRIDLMGEQRTKDNNYTTTSHYINVPIAAKFYPVDGLFVECGPQFGFLVSKKDKVEGYDDTVIFHSNSGKPFEFGVFGGVGYRSANNMFVEARYIHGLTDTHKDIKGYRNRNVQISLGYLF